MARSMHLATKNDQLGTRLVVAYKQIPGDPLNALVINIDKLAKNVDRDELVAMVHSNDSQHERDFINVLHRRGLLEFYHKAGYLEKVSIDDIIMTPEGTQRIPLRTVIDAVNAQNGAPPLATQEQMNAISAGNPYASEKRSEILLEDGNKAIAQNVLFQAKLMQDEANKKFAEALNLDPSLADTIETIRAGRELKKPMKFVAETKTSTGKKTKASKK